MSEPPRFAFPPLENRGVLLGLSAGQLAGCGAAVLAAVVLRAAWPGSLGTAGALVVAGGVASAALWSRDRRPVGAWILLWLWWALRRAGGPRLGLRPEIGRPLRSGGGEAAAKPGARVGAELLRRPAGSRLGTAPPGLALVEVPARTGQAPLGLVIDRRRRTAAGVLPVGGCSYSLMDPEDQVRLLEGWRRVLGALARPGSPIQRLQWVHRTGPVPASRLRDLCPPASARSADRPPAGGAGALGGAPATAGAGVGEGAGGSDGAGAGGSPGASYRSLLAATLPLATEHRSWLAVVVANGRTAAAAEVLGRELRLLAGQLRAADLDPGKPLGVAGLCSVISSPGRREPASAFRLLAGDGYPEPTDSACESDAAPAADQSDRVWPVAMDDGWSAVRVDGAWHCTFWVSEWPRVAVGPGFLSPLLSGSACWTVSVLLAPVDPERALRQARSSRTATLADARLRSRAGFLPSARRDRESEGTVQREVELADGHSEYRFSAYLTVSAGTPSELETACAEAEHAARSAHLELRRMYGRQAEAYWWTQPVGRGLR